MTQNILKIRLSERMIATLKEEVFAVHVSIVMKKDTKLRIVVKEKTKKEKKQKK